MREIAILQQSPRKPPRKGYYRAMTLRRHWLRVLKVSVASVFAVVVIAYISILIAQAVSARRASKMLDALEAIRIGDPASSLKKQCRSAR